MLSLRQNRTGLVLQIGIHLMHQVHLKGHSMHKCTSKGIAIMSVARSAGALVLILAGVTQISAGQNRAPLRSAFRRGDPKLSLFVYSALFLRNSHTRLRGWYSTCSAVLPDRPLQHASYQACQGLSDFFFQPAGCVHVQAHVYFGIDFVNVLTASSTTPGKSDGHIVCISPAQSHSLQTPALVLCNAQAAVARCGIYPCLSV